MMSGILSIGEVAKRAGVGVETVRFYERKGLIDEPARRLSGYRQYELDVVDRLRFIRRAKELGFTLREIKDLLELKVDPDADCGDVKQRAEAKLADIEAKIESLERMRTTLSTLIRSCNSGKRTESCPILRGLAEETKR